MKNVSIQSLAYLLSVSALSLASASAQAEPTSPLVETYSPKKAVSETSSLETSAIESSNPLEISEENFVPIPTLAEIASNPESETPEESFSLETVETSANYLKTLPEQTSEVPNFNLAQTRIERGRLTRNNYSYIGVGANIGFDGEISLGDGGVAVNGKIALGSQISFRPAVIFSGDASFLIPITYDFSVTQDDPFDPVDWVPFAGAGVVFTTDDDSELGFLLTGGVDYRISEDFVAHGSLNIGFVEDETALGLLLTVGYIFPDF